MPRGMADRQLTNKLRTLHAAHAEAKLRKMPVDEALGERAERSLRVHNDRSEKQAMEQAQECAYVFRPVSAKSVPQPNAGSGFGGASLVSITRNY